MTPRIGCVASQIILGLPLYLYLFRCLSLSATGTSFDFTCPGYRAALKLPDRHTLLCGSVSLYIRCHARKLSPWKLQHQRPVLSCRNTIDICFYDSMSYKGATPGS